MKQDTQQTIKYNILQCIYCYNICDISKVEAMIIDEFCNKLVMYNIITIIESIYKSKRKGAGVVELARLENV